MALTKYHIGDFVELHNVACNIPHLTPDEVSGVGRDKEFFEPSRQVGSDTTKYKVVPPQYFACNLMHVGRDIVLPIALNHTEHDKYVSPAYSIFFITDESIVLKEYFLMMMVSEERDRYFWFHTDSSVRDGLSWDEFCALEIELPDIPTQQKFVDVYKAMVANQKCYENGLSDMKLTCDAYIEDLRRKMPCEKIGPYIQQSDRRNDIGLTQDDVRGITTAKELIPTKASMNGVSVDNYKLVEPGAITYVPDTSRRGDKISLAMNNTDDTYLVSSISSVFTTDKKKLLPEYLMLFFSRAEFDRYTRFHSWGSARETFNWDDMQAVKVPIPDIHVQQAIVNIYKCYLKRKEINERLKAQIKDLCPILIRGSLQEGGKTQ